MPEDDFEYEKVCYDLSDFCNKCGIGKVQVKPLRMKAEPKWGKKHILQLNWIFDEYFTLPDVWESTFKPFGIDCKPVIHHRSGKELETVVQLDVAKIAKSSLQFTDEHRYAICGDCNRKKYLPIVRGPYPLFEQQPSDHMLKTQEYFGSGASAKKAIMVSSTLFRQIKQHKLKGVEFFPCSDVMA